MSRLGGKKMSEDTDRDNNVTSIVAGTNIDNIDNTDPENPVINASAGGGETNTASNVGGEAGTIFKQKTGVDLELKTIKQGSRVTITNNASDIEVAADVQLKNTTKGDLEGFSTVAARIPVGTDAQVLTADSAEALGVKWATPAAASGDVATDTIWDVKGDLAGGTGADTAVRLAVGTNDQVLTADSAEATGMKWATPATGSTSSARVRRDTDLPITVTTDIVWQTEVFDDNSFVDIGTNNDRMTVPTGVTRVNVSCSVTYTNTVTVGSNYILWITQFNSGGTEIEKVAGQNGQWGTGAPTVSACALSVPCVATDYFEVRVFNSDAAVTIAFATASIQDVS